MNLRRLPIRLEGLQFKGDRDYLQGAEILPLALRALSDDEPRNAISAIDIVFHALAHTGLTLAEDVPQGHAANAQLSCTINGTRHKLFLVEDGRPITERHPYPEEQIVSVTAIDASSATATSAARLPFTNIQRWIAMTKALHHAVYPQAKGKWLFARAKLVTYDETAHDGAEHRVQIQSDFGGKLTRSALTVDGRNIGDIFFALA